MNQHQVWTYRMENNPSDKRFKSLITYKDGEGHSLTLVPNRKWERVVEWHKERGDNIEVSEEINS